MIETITLSWYQQIHCYEYYTIVSSQFFSIAYCKVVTVNQEYFVSKIFRIFIFRMYKFSYICVVLQTCAYVIIYEYLSENLFIFEFLNFVCILLYENYNNDYNERNNNQAVIF